MKNFPKRYTYFPIFLNRKMGHHCNCSLISKNCHFEGHLLVVYDDIFQFSHFGFSVLPFKRRLLTATSPFLVL